MNRIQFVVTYFWNSVWSCGTLPNPPATICVEWDAGVSQVTPGQLIYLSLCVEWDASVLQVTPGQFIYLSLCVEWDAGVLQVTPGQFIYLSPCIECAGCDYGILVYFRVQQLGSVCMI